MGIVSVESKVMPEGNHETKPIMVWADVDVEIAPMVIYLNTIPGVRTDASCKGTIGDGGPNPYGPYVMARWPIEAEKRLKKEFDVEVYGEGWGYIRPKR